MTEEEEFFNEEEEPLPYEEDEEDDDNEFDIGDEPDLEYEAQISKLASIISFYNAFIYQYPAMQDGEVINLIIPSNFLPLAQLSVYGFNVSSTLLEIHLQLNNFNWKNKPKSCNVKHPIFGQNYVGYALVKQVIGDFFNPFYKPKSNYRSATYLLSADQGKADNSLLQQLLKEGFERQRAVSALILTNNNFDKARDFLRTGEAPPLSTTIHVSYSESPLIYFVLEICDVFIDLSDHCCICREPLSEPTVRPFPCQKPVCQMAFSEMGVGTSILQEIKRDPYAADLLISCFAAAIGTRFLTPEPPGFSKNEIKQLLQNLPAVRDMMQLSDERALLDMIGPRLLTLLRWIILSIHSQFISLPDELKLKEFPSRCQFLTLMSSVEKEQKFRALRAQYGSYFLWHGSTTDRWHSIIRQGLKNGTGTHLQQNGAALGSGIYFARSSNTSIGYSRGFENPYRKSLLGNQLSIVSLCEVAKVPELKDQGWAHTCVNEDACIVRFLFVGPNFNRDTIADPPKNIPKLRDVLKYHADHSNQQ